MRKRATTIVVGILGKQYRKEAMNQSTKPLKKIEAKRLRATTFAITKLEER